jgi:hypothetical protein
MRETRFDRPVFHSAPCPGTLLAFPPFRRPMPTPARGAVVAVDGDATGRAWVRSAGIVAHQNGQSRSRFMRSANVLAFRRQYPRTRCVFFPGRFDFA